MVHDEFFRACAWLVAYFRPLDGPDLMLLLANGVVCTITAVLFALSPGSIPGERKTWPVRLVRIAVAFVPGFTAWRIWGGHYQTPVEPGELLLNVFLMIQALMVRGDVELWFRVYNTLRHRRRHAYMAAKQCSLRQWRV